MVTMQPPASLDDGAATAQALFTIRNVVVTRILLGLGLYITLMVFAVGVRDLIRRTNAEYEWVGTLSLVPYDAGLEAAMKVLIDEYTLQYTGIKRIEHEYFHAVYGADDVTRHAYLERAYRLGREF